VCGAGDAVDGGGVHVQNVGLREQFMQKGLHARSARFALGAGKHEVVQDLLFALGFLGGVAGIPHGVKTRTLHLYKAVRSDVGKRGAGAFDIQKISVLAGGVAAARKHICGVCTVTVGHGNEVSDHIVCHHGLTFLLLWYF